MKELTKTGSICPECLKIIPATVFERDGKVWMKKACEQHGEFEDLYLGSYDWYMRAERYARDGKGVQNPQVTKESPSCPKDCGLCRMHCSHTALANIVLTNRCDLTCWYCFFYSGRVGYVYEPKFEEIEEMVKILKAERPIPCNAVQLTGGEPCLREDLVEIIKMVKSHGIDHIQLNTNGIRLSQDPGLVERVRAAGANTIYLSFDGVSEKTNPKNHWEVPQLIENCRKADMGIVLVPTVINSVNDHEVGDILKFGFKNNDIVRGVNFQPVSLVGMMPREERERYRITIPDLMKRLEEQTDGAISMRDFFPVPTAMILSEFIESLVKKQMYDLSSHFACGAATYVFNDNGKILPLTHFVDVEGFLEYLREKSQELQAGKSKMLVGAKLLYNIGKFIDKKKKPKGLDVDKIIFNALIKHEYNAIGQFHMKSLFIGIMHFMDLYNYDIERVKRCCIHYVMNNKRIIPFCAFNVIPEWYRDKNQAAQGLSFEEWEKKTGRSLKDDLYKRDAEKLKQSEAYWRFVSQIEEIKAGKL
ncbi:MAG: tetraether lipid synthase Tes [Methanobacteriota archaeon]